MKSVVFLVFVGVAISCCMAAVPLDEPKKLVKVPDAIVEPEVVLAEPLNPSVLAQGSGFRLVRQAYDDVSVDVVNSKWYARNAIEWIVIYYLVVCNISGNGGGGGGYGGDYGGGYGGDYGNGGDTEVDVNVQSF